MRNAWISTSFRTPLLVGLLFAFTSHSKLVLAADELPTTQVDPALGHKEQPEDPPLPDPGVPPGRPLPRHTVERNGHVSVQVNVDAFGNNIVADAANEPSIAVDPSNPSRMAIGWRQFDNVGSNFRQAGWGYTRDGGTTWTFPGKIDPGVFRSDPVLQSNADGVFYYNSLTSDFLCQFFISTDGGVSWSDAIPAFGGDKAWVAIDQTTGIGRGHIYCEWSSGVGCCGDRIFTRSTDGGQTYSEPVIIPGSPQWGTSAVGPDGRLYIAGAPLFTSNASISRSSNAQNPAAIPTFDFTRYVHIGGTTAFSAGPNPDGLLGQMNVAAGPIAGHVYLLSSIATFAGDPLDVMFTRSTDGGVTWDPPVRVNDDPEGNGAWQWFGTMSVAPNGRLDAVWNDTRADPSATFSELYYAFSLDGGLTWSANVPVSPPFNHFLGYPNQRKLGDYYDMVSDNFGADLAYAATFNGEQDVYYLRINADDCNGNQIDDALDIAAGTSLDCNTNALPDECERDCNTNGTPDDCDVVEGTSFDCNGNGTPDDCELDCNTNGTPDDCDVRDGTSPDCNEDGLPDECQLMGNDCDDDGVPDECQIARIITMQPTDMGVCPQGTAHLSVGAQGDALTYRWRRNGLPLADGGDISGSATATLTIENFDGADAGRYVCAVADGCLATTSDGAVLTLLVPVTIIGQPQSLTQRCVGFTAFFSVEAGGSLLSYRWHKDGVPLMDDERIIGSDTADMEIANITAADNGSYFCAVDDTCGGQVESQSRTLLVVNPVFIRQPKNACAEVGETARFTAEAIAPPSQTIGWRWRKNGVIVADGGHISGAKTDSLTITGVTDADASGYSALAFSSDPVCLTDSAPATLTVGDCASCAHPGDADEDGDYDLADISVFTQCFGEDVTSSPQCVCANVDDSDDTINLDDWIQLEALLTGPR